MTDRGLWIGLTLAALVIVAVFDIIAFVMEVRSHGLTRKAKVELVALVALLFLALGDIQVARLDAAHDELETARTAAIERTVAPRVMSPVAIADTVATLKLYGPGSIEINFVGEDRESQQLAEQLAAVFRSAGWSVPPISDALVSPPPWGVEFVVHPSHPIYDANGYAPMMLAALHALTRTGLSFALANDTRVPRDQVQIRIGHRPPN